MAERVPLPRRAEFDTATLPPPTPPSPALSRMHYVATGLPNFTYFEIN